MKRSNRILSLLLALAMLFLCAAGSLAEQEAAEGGMVLNDGSPWVDYSLRENIALVEEKPASPKDDFYLWTNYDWLKSAEIEPGKPSADPFTDISQEIMNQCLEVLADPALKSEDAALAQHLYRAFLDWDARNALGVAPLKNIADRISAVSSIDELTQLLCDPGYTGAKLFTFDVSTRPNDPDTWITYIQPPKLLLEDSAEYRERTEQGNLFEAVYREFLPRMLGRLGYSTEEASAMLTRFFALETELADSIMTAAEKMAPDFVQRANNELDRAEAEKLCGTFPWIAILDAQGYAGAQRYLVVQPAYLQKMDEIYQESRLEDLKNYLLLRTANTHMSVLDRESYDLYTGMVGAMYGIKGALPDEEMACTFVRSYLPAQIDRAFFEKFDASKMKEDITRLCREVIAVFREMLSEEDWLTEETRAKAIEKLDAIRVIAVYPEKWPDYNGLSLDGLGLCDSIHAINRYKAGISASLADQPVDHDLWYCTLDNDWANDILETNATYNPGDNGITIFRGILGNAFYREDMSDEELYGAIGLIIAHEISHAFDPTGAQFDATGRMNSWWTEADNAAFAARAQKLIDYYNGMTLFNGLQIPGKNIQGEAVADMGAVKCMLRLLEQKKESVDYRAFFESFARCWRFLVSWETEYYFLTQDPHPSNNIRVNSLVQQFSQFHETYGIKEGDGMWLAPEDRVQVW